MSCFALHNYLCLLQNAHYPPSDFVDSEDSRRNIIPNEWRRLPEYVAYKSIKGFHARVDAIEILLFLVGDLDNKNSSVLWQLQCIG